jgi:hypothetical protein
VVVADPEPDEGHESLICVEWRPDDDDGDLLELREDAHLSIRHPLELEDSP